MKLKKIIAFIMAISMLGCTMAVQSSAAVPSTNSSWNVVSYPNTPFSSKVYLRNRGLATRMSIDCNYFHNTPDKGQRITFTCPYTIKGYITGIGESNPSITTITSDYDMVITVTTFDSTAALIAKGTISV